LGAREAADSGSITNVNRDDSAVGRSADFDYSSNRDPGVPLRSTPGFMLSSAPRTFNFLVSDQAGD